MSSMNATSIQRHLHIPENHFQLTDSESKQSIKMYSAVLACWEDDSQIIHVEERYCCEIKVSQGEEGKKRHASLLDQQ